MIDRSYHEGGDCAYYPAKKYVATVLFRVVVHPVQNCG
jgi:hypothetical protein